MLRALAASVAVGLSAPALGTYLVQRRLSLIGDGLGHVALTGVGVGLLLQGSPVIWAVIVAAVGAIAVELIRERGRTSGDIALAILFYGGLAGGVVLIGLAHGNASLTSYLFGSPLSTTRADLVVVWILAVAVLAVSLLLRPWLFAVCQDEEYARVAGLPVRALNLTVAVTAAVTVTVGMRSVGLLLVSALMVVPVATTQQLARGFRTTQHGAMLLGALAAVVGMWLSAELDTAPGATIVLTAIAGFLGVSVGVAAWRTAVRRRGRAALTAGTTAVTAVGAPGAEPPEVVLNG
jgi:zinc transport system permease protein